MVTRYDVISSRWLSHFLVKRHVFSTFFSNKSKTCGWNHAMCLFMFFYTSSTKITINGDFYLISKGLDEVNWQLAFVFPPTAPIQTLKTGASLLSFQTIPCVHKSHLFPARLGNGQQCSNATLFCTQNQSLNHHFANGYYVICHVTYLEGYPRGSPSPTIYLFSKGRVYLNDCTIHNPF